VRMFDSSGWAGTTIGSIAKDAGVAVETIYSGFGSKKALLRAAMDMAVVGDGDPIPFAEREEFIRMGQGTSEERLRWGITVVTNTHERSAGVWRAIMEAAVADPEIDQWRVELEEGRRIDVERSFRLVFGAETDEMTNDWLWMIVGPEIYLKLTRDLALPRERYEAYLLTAIERLVRTG
jgi:AcrR family transcriptional regulator